MTLAPSTRYTLGVDHLVVAAPDLDEAVEAVESALGLELEAGGSHPGLGTRNRLLGLGAGAYLEVIAPDPEQPEPDAPRPFGIDQLETPTLVTWALAVGGGVESDGVASDDSPSGYQPFRSMSRRRPDGGTLSWKIAFPTEAARIDSPVQPVPFLIDWRGMPSPGETLDARAQLDALRIWGPSNVAAALDVIARLASSEDGATERVVVELARGPVRFDAEIRVGDRSVVWSGAISQPFARG